ncbi:hypothetical protein B0H11DRAFT_917058 [Mycena galericulata]|nr:hypothetical protein B0H11DRAFT_917058 [Mycena galericulata]
MLPSMERVGDTFEALVGAAAVHLGTLPTMIPAPTPTNCLSGFFKTLSWLGDLFSPWVHRLARKDPSAVFISSTSRIKYTKVLHRVSPERVAPLRDTTLNAESFPVVPECHPSLSVSGLSVLVGSTGPQWADVDVSKVVFPPGYPPTPPRLNQIHPTALKDAMTDVVCHIHFGETPNNAYRAVGERVCTMTVTMLAIAKLPRATVAELDDVRLECLNSGILARIALLLNLHRHLRILRRDDDHSCYLGPADSQHAFEALVGVIYVELGWCEVVTWLDELFAPWIDAAGDGRLRADAGAEKRRQIRLRHNEAKKAQVAKAKAEAMERAAKEKAEEALQSRRALEEKTNQGHGAIARRRYSSTVPGRNPSLRRSLAARTGQTFYFEGGRGMRRKQQ